MRSFAFSIVKLQFHQALQAQTMEAPRLPSSCQEDKTKAGNRWL
jgi:hypothetical protein